MLDDQVEGVLLNSQTRAVTIFLAIFSLLGVVDVALNIHRVDRLITGVAVLVLMVVLAVRTAKSSIKWNRQGIVARQTGATRRLAWSQIAGFEYREFRGLRARLRNGRWVNLMPYPRNRLNKPEQAIATLETARQVEQQRRAP